MSNLELEFHFERAKREILEKIDKVKEKWEWVWAQSLGKPEAEAELIPLKLEIQVIEVRVLEEFKKLEDEIRKFQE